MELGNSTYTVYSGKFDAIERVLDHLKQVDETLKSTSDATIKTTLIEHRANVGKQLAALTDTLPNDVVKLPSVEQLKKVVQTCYVEAQKPKNDGKSFVTRLSDMLHERLSKGQ